MTSQGKRIEMTASQTIDEEDLIPHSRAILTTLILGTVITSINLGIANVALPSVAISLRANSSQQNWIATGFTLALAATVLYLGAISDRYGRRMMFLIGAAATIPTALLSALAWSPTALIFGRILSGLAGAALVPTSLSLITAIWPAGPGRTQAIALWSGIGGGMSALGPLFAGLLIQWLSWNWAFALPIPLALIDVYLAWRYLPVRNKESTNPVDHLGGILSVIFVGSLIYAINELPSGGFKPLVITLFSISVIALGAFIWHELHSASPLMDLMIWKNRVFTGAAVAATIAFGALMGALYIGQQYLQNVLSYNPLVAGVAILPIGIFIMIGAPIGGRLLGSVGSRMALASGLAGIGMGFLVMLLFWQVDSSYLIVGLAYALLGLGVGMASTPASRSLMGTVPITKAGFGSAISDLTRDFGGAIGQAVMGALLAIRYTSFFQRAFANLPAEQAQNLSQQVANTLSKSFAGAVQVAREYSANKDDILSAAKSAFLHGQVAAMLIGVIAAIVAIVFVLLIYPNKATEDKILEKIARENEQYES